MSRPSQSQSPELIEIGKRIRKLRLDKGHNNYEIFAALNGFPRSKYGRYEKGDDMLLSSFVRVLKALDVSYEEFFAEDFNPDAPKKAPEAHETDRP